MRLGLAWLDPSDPTDWAVASGLHGALKRLGHEAVVIGPRRRRGDAARETREGISIRRFGADTKAISRFADEHGIELWHFHVFARDARPFLAAARDDGRPMVASLHLILPDYLPHLGGRPALKALLRRAGAVTTVSEASRRELKHLYPELAARPSVVYNGPGPRAKPAAAAAHSSLYVLCVARLAPYKGTDILLMAFAQALKDAPELRLVLCGRDQLNGAVARFMRRLGLQDRVTLTGGLPPAKVAGLLRDCRIFVLPSRRENFPLALLEAMAAGKPCVASAVGGMPEMIRHGREGLLVPAGDAGALARALSRLAGDAGLRRRLGTAAKKRSLDWNWKRAAAGYARIYETLAR
jgi:glycosyltransferase involved in cell wall biosynthesis